MLYINLYNIYKYSTKTYLTNYIATSQIIISHIHHIYIYNIYRIDDLYSEYSIVSYNIKSPPNIPSHMPIRIYHIISRGMVWDHMI